MNPLSTGNADNAFWRNRKVLVTGAGGFIGSHLVERLANEGAQVTAYVRYNAGGSRGLLDHLPLPLLQQIRIVYGDLCNDTRLDQELAECDTVFHLAAIIAIPFSYAAPVQVIENNITSTLRILEAVRKSSVRRLIHTSSSEVYGTAQKVPIDESHPLEAQSPYAASKIACDKLVQSYSLSYDVPAVTLRPFNTYGPRQSARAIIPTIITQALTRKQINLGSMHPTRDFNFVSDTVEAFLKIASTEGIEGRTYHVGSGKELSIGNLADRIVEIINPELTVAFDPMRIRPSASEVNRLICDNTRAHEDLGWTPSVSLSDGLKQTIDWVGKNLGAYRPETYAV